MKPKILAILLLLALIPPVMSEENRSLPTQSANAYGIDPDKLYPGALVLELLLTAEDEAATQVSNAYDEGYKAGRIDGAAIWGGEYKKLQAENTRLAKRPGWGTVISIGISLGIGALGAGIVIGMAVH